MQSLDKMTLNVALYMLKKQSCVAVDELMSVLGLGSNDLLNAIKVLRFAGFVVSECGGKGYRVVVEDDLRYAHEVVSGLGTRIRYGVHYVEQCSTTQDVAMDLAVRGAPEGTVVVCGEMWSGRGRMGRKWYAPRGGLWFTLILRPRSLSKLNLLTLATGVSVAKALNHLFNVDARVKWPNDVVIEGKKVSGALLEVKHVGEELVALLGVGINVNNDLPLELEGYATSLKRVLGFPVPRTPIFVGILKSVDYYYSAIVEGDVGRIIGDWRLWSSTLGRYVRAVMASGVVEGRAVDVDESGALLIDTGSGVVRVVEGDIIHLR